VLAGLRDRPKQKDTANKKLLAFADPVYEEQGNETMTQRALLRGAFGDQQWHLERLVESGREVQQIAGLYPPGQSSLLLREQATEENVKTSRRLNEYRYIHFATHGLLNEQRPYYSGLILSLPKYGKAPAALPADKGATTRSDQPQIEDGLLQVYEIFGLKLNADLVVLSACETGLGKELRGEGLVGLTRAFLYAGTPSVIVSLWKVQDRSTSDLMVNFYKDLNQSKEKTEALRLAKLNLIKSGRYSHPYYWAPFILVGDPR